MSPADPSSLRNPASTAGAEDRLSGGLRLYVYSSSDNEYFTGPSFVAVHLDAEALQHLLRRAQFCKAEGANFVELDAAPVDFDREGSELKISAWRMRVAGDEFWLDGRADDGMGCITAEVPTDDLLAALRTNESTPEDAVPAGFAWYGGALLYSPEELPHLIDTLEDGRPELAAKQRELEMAGAIAGHKPVMDQEEPQGSAPRRRPAL